MVTGNESRVLDHEKNKPNEQKPQNNPKKIHGCMKNCASENII
jgi:hypothetical protein